MRKDRTGTLLLGYLLLYIAFATLLISYFSSQDSQGYRIGATCSDGWSSSATGSGACSHHGGVAQWRYSQEPGSDPSDGYNAALIMAAIGGVMVMYAKSVEEKNDYAHRLASVESSSPTPVQEKPTETKRETPIISVIQRTELPLVYTKPQQCTCGAWMFKTKDNKNNEIFKCSRTPDCGKTKPANQPEI